MSDDRMEKQQRHSQVAKVFTPGSPVGTAALFAGRLDQIFQISTALNQPGRHVMLYGERGVGKTSLATLLKTLLVWEGDDGGPTVRVNCATQDNFRSVWTRVFRELELEVPDEWHMRAPDPDDVRYALSRLDRSRLIIIDEFDRMEDDESLSLMADTIKGLSDYAVPSKLIIVGVADSIDSLIGEHESVQRAVEEVHMPRMAEAELHEIIDKGMSTLGMTITDTARRRMARISEGLPHYVHELALHATQRAVMSDRTNVTVEDLETAIAESVKRHSLRKEYTQAIQSPRKDTLYAKVLTACALAEKNPLGAFTAGAVKEPMSRIMGKPYEIPAFATHLKAFTELDRGSVLKREGIERRYVYRFRNPLLQPFAIMVAMADGILPEDYSRELFG